MYLYCCIMHSVHQPARDVQLASASCDFVFRQLLKNACQNVYPGLLQIEAQRSDACESSPTAQTVMSGVPVQYNSYTTHFKEAECLRQQVEPFLYNFGVDIVFHGECLSCHFTVTHAC